MRKAEKGLRKFSKELKMNNYSPGDQNTGASMSLKLLKYDAIEIAKVRIVEIRKKHI